MVRPSQLVVRDDLLSLSARQLIRVDTPAWFAWLEQATSFSYRPGRSSYRLSFRKEKRRHQSYWYAYLKEDGKLHNAYVGCSPALTAARLRAVTQQLVDKARLARPAVGPEGGKLMP
jgi:LuxR family maltose regulon positive regulatory protein